MHLILSKLSKNNLPMFRNPTHFKNLVCLKLLIVEFSTTVIFNTPFFKVDASYYLMVVGVHHT